MPDLDVDPDLAVLRAALDRGHCDDDDPDGSKLASTAQRLAWRCTQLEYSGRVGFDDMRTAFAAAVRTSAAQCRERAGGCPRAAALLLAAEVVARWGGTA